MDLGCATVQAFADTHIRFDTEPIRFDIEPMLVN